MRGFTLLAGIILTASSSWAASSVETLVDCQGYKIQYSGAAPRFVPGNPLNNTDSSREGWAIVDGQYSGANVYFVDLNGTQYPVNMHREMAFQYNRYIIEEDILSIPTFDP